MSHPSPRQRRQWIAWYDVHGQDVTATCRQFGMSRPTFYRWLARYTAAPTQPLRSRRLHTRRRPTWSTDELRILCEFLGRYPTLGRGRLTKCLNHLAQTHWSPATVGRMLRQMQPRCPICRGRNGHHIYWNPALRKDLYALTGGVLTSPGLRLPQTPRSTSSFVKRKRWCVIPRTDPLVQTRYGVSKAACPLPTLYGDIAGLIGSYRLGERETYEGLDQGHKTGENPPWKMSLGY